MKKRLVKFIKKNKKLFTTSGSILNLVSQAREGGILSKILAGFSATGEIIQLVFPDSDPYTALKQEGLIYYDSSVVKLLYKFLLSSGTGEILAQSDGSSAFVWKDDGESKIGLLVYISGWVEVFVKPGAEEFLVRLIRGLVWNLSNEVELSKSSNNLDHNNISLMKMSDPGPYLGEKDPEWYANRLRKYPPGPRTVLFRGLTGTGKGVLARHVAKLLKGEDSLVLKISSESLLNCEQKEIIDLVKILQPTVLLLDDLELNDKDKVKTFLALFETLRDPNCLVIATMMLESQETKLERGSLYLPGMRPGRIDEIFIFDLPNAEERLKILSYYAVQQKCLDLILNTALLKKVVKKTEGLSGAYLKTVVERLSAHGLENWQQEIDFVIYSAPKLTSEENKAGDDKKATPPK